MSVIVIQFCFTDCALAEMNFEKCVAHDESPI